MADFKESKYWISSSDNLVKCLLCPHECIIKEEKYGICRVRKNIGGKLFTGVYGKIVARNLDPIEKKPLYHFYPGKQILSIGTAGCNLQCFFCQNFNISQTFVHSFANVKEISPWELVQMAHQTYHNIGIAFTYNEPVVFYEYMYDTAMIAKEENLKTVMITNGFISVDPLKNILPLIDAFNVDLKAFSDSFYRKNTKSAIGPVKSTLFEVHKSGKHLEITFLVIPGLNDNESEFKEMISWIADNFGETQILHISRYFPNYLSEIPSTPINVMRKMYELARNKLTYVYLGNMSVSEEQNTYCHHCGKLVIERDHFNVKVLLDKGGKCPGCQTQIIIHI